MTGGSGVQRRGYAGPADLRAMQRLVQRTWSIDRGWHIGDLAWGRYQHTGREPEWPTALWSSGGEVLAWGWARLPGMLELQVDPAHPELAAEVLAWFDGVATGGELSVPILGTETELAAVLAGHGYAPVTEPGMLLFSRDLTNLTDPAPPPGEPEPQLPAGYRLRPVTAADLAQRVAVHRAAFAPSRVTERSYAAVQAAWPYRAELDWIAEHADGCFAASCLIWLDEVNGVAELEPVGAHPEHRRRGLARAVCLAAMRAARAAGARLAIVASNDDPVRPAAPALYRSLGFRVHTRTVTYRQQRPARPAGR